MPGTSGDPAELSTPLRPAVPIAPACDCGGRPTHSPTCALRGGPAADALPLWTPTRALGRAVLLTGLLLIGGVLLGRVDLVVLATPFALGTAVALLRRPTSAPVLRIGTTGAPAGDDPTRPPADPSASRSEVLDLVEGGGLTGRVRVGNVDEAGYDVVLTRAVVSPWLRLAEADRPHASVLPRGRSAEVVLPGEAVRWGRHAIGPVAARAVACDGLLAGRPVVAPARVLSVFPLTEPFQAVEAMPRAAGLVGGHRSRRPGEGGELAGVRMFAPGDRLRRVDWRVSLRTRQLHVAATLSDRDAEVVLLLDLLTEAGTSGGIHGTPSVLDTTVRAAAAIAEHYLHRGDRVSLVEFGARARRLRPASGRRQYLTALEWLLDVRAIASPYTPDERIFGPNLVSSNALVVVLTPMIDERSAAMLARLARSGRFVVAVDTLPVDARPPQRRPWTELAYRLWRLERGNTLGQLREHGVPVVGWAGAGSLDLVLRDVARLASAPRVGQR
jgi:uncharacterized protein (DUF58 family)